MKTAEELVAMGYLQPSEVGLGDRVKAAQRTQEIDEKEAIRRANAGLDETGRAIRPEYTTLLDEKGNLKDQYRLSYGGAITPDQQGIQAFRQRALQQGPSSWANLALQRQGLEEQGLRDTTQQQGASAASQARSSLASKFGLSPAAQERLARQQMRDQAMGMQNVAFQGAKSRSDIGLEDERMKNQFLQQLPQQDLAFANQAMQNRQAELDVNKYNIGQAVGDVARQNAQRLGVYNEQMREWAAGRQADSMSGGGGK